MDWWQLVPIVVLLVLMYQRVLEQEQVLEALVALDQLPICDFLD
jgi:hypothetical protein